MTYAYNSILGCALGDDTERKLRIFFQQREGREKRADISQDEVRQAGIPASPVALEPDSCIRKTIVRVSNSQDGGFDNVTVDLISSVLCTLSRRRRHLVRSRT